MLCKNGVVIIYIIQLTAATDCSKPAFCQYPLPPVTLLVDFSLCLPAEW
jgi:hypothetical protein